MGFRIVDWQHFEPKHGKRDQYKHCIPNILVPTSTDKVAYSRLTSGRQGAANLGCWIAIVQFWARQKKENRLNGFLWCGSGPASIDDIGTTARLPIKALEAAIDKLLEIHWLEQWQPGVSQASATCQPDGSTKAIQGKDKVKIKQSNSTPRFETFWQAYPKKKSKGYAEKVFAKIKPDEQLLATMLAKIEQAKKSVEWCKDKGQFIPHPATWLNAKGWEDEYVLPGLSRRYQAGDQAAADRARWSKEAKAIAISNKPQAVRLKEALELVKEQAKHAQEHAGNGSQDPSRET